MQSLNLFGRIIRCCFCLSLAALALVLTSAAVRADSLRLTETRSDKLKCGMDRSLGERFCGISTTGKFNLTLSISPATLRSLEVDLASVLAAAAEGGLSVSFSVGLYQFNGEVGQDADVDSSLTETSVNATWTDLQEKCLDQGCAETKTIPASVMKVSGSVDKGLLIRLKGTRLSYGANDYGEVLFTDSCSTTGTFDETVSLILADSLPIDLPVTVLCQFREREIRRGDFEGESLTRERISARLAAPEAP